MGNCGYFTPFFRGVITDNPTEITGDGAPFTELTKAPGCDEGKWQIPTRSILHYLSWSCRDRVGKRRWETFRRWKLRRWTVDGFFENKGRKKKEIRVMMAEAITVTNK